MTVLADKPDQVDSLEVQRAKSRSRFLTITVIVLAVALIGLGAWVVYDTTTAAETAVTAEIEELIDDYIAAWNGYDTAAFGEVVTVGYTFDVVGISSSDSFDVLETATMINSSLKPLGWSVTVIGEPIMVGDGPWYVSQAEHFTQSGSGPDGTDGVSTFTIVDRDGTLEIARHTFVGNN